MAACRVYRQANVLQCLQRTLRVWELLRVVWTVYMYPGPMSQNGEHGTDVQAALHLRRPRELTLLGQGEPPNLQPLFSVQI